MLLEVNSRDADIRRTGRVLAVLLLGIFCSEVVISAINIVQGQYQYNLSNALSLLIVFGLLLLNRSGRVSFASLITVALMAIVPFLVFETSDLKQVYSVHTFSIIAASFLLVPWGSFAAAGFIIGASFYFGLASDDFYLPLIILTVVACIAYLFAHSLEHAYTKNKHIALHDALTGMPNRVLFLENLETAAARAERVQSMMAVLFIDLDDFKLVNDSLGHKAGDDLLVQVGARLEGGLGLKGTAARLSGDEFTVLLEGVVDTGEPVKVAKRIYEDLEKPFGVGGHEVVVKASVGIALAADTSVAPGDLLRNANVAMYRAKRGKLGYAVYDPSMHAEVLERLRMENDLRRAIDNEEFEVHYQPKVSLKTGELVGVEALVRWQHPERGLVPPGQFIPLAEETGLIVPIGMWVLETACRQAKEWEAAYLDAPLLTMAVNLSARQFKQPGLTEDILKALQRSGLEPHRLQLEVTESVVTDNSELAVRILRELRELGVKSAMDDFGTGYSSLGYLKILPLNNLKVDRSFVKGLGKDDEDSAIVRLVVDLAHTLGLQVTAEGIETAEQLDHLKGMGCDLGQGYYFARPLKSEAIAELLSDAPVSLLEKA